MDLNENEIYTTDYKYLENQIEEMVPLKFLITGSQKINQLLFVSKDNTIKIYYEAKGILDSRYVIELNDKKYFCYLRQEFETLCDGIIALLLYLDRSEYSSSYFVHKSYTLTKRYTYDKTKTKESFTDVERTMGFHAIEKKEIIEICTYISLGHDSNRCNFSWNDIFISIDHV